MAYTPTPIVSGYNSETALNQNFTDIKTAIDDSLSKSGEGANSLTADLDLNSNNLLNGGSVHADNIYLNGKVVTTTLVGAVEDASLITYTPAVGSVTNVEAHLDAATAAAPSLEDLGIAPGGVYSHTDIADAINGSTAPIIRIDDGTYTPTGTGRIILTRGVELVGGRLAILNTDQGITFNNCSGGRLTGFTLDSDSASYHFTVWFRGSGGDHVATGLNITSTYGAMSTGDSADADSPINCAFQLCTTSSALGSLNRVSGASPRTYSNIKYLYNNMTINGGVGINIVGIETWAGGTKIIGNSIIAPTLAGEFGGVTLGLYPDQVVAHNRIFGFEAGIEWGNTSGMLQMHHNLLLGCKYGMYDGTSGEEIVPNFQGNIVIQGPTWGHTPISAFEVKSKSVDLGGSACIYTTDGDFTTGINITGTPPSGTYAVKATTATEVTTVTNLRIYNYDTGLRAGATGGTNILSNFLMDKVRVPIDDSGGSPINLVSNGQIKDFAASRVNKHVAYSNVHFSREVGDRYAGHIDKLHTQFLASADTHHINNGCTFTGVQKSCFDVDGGMPLGVGGGWSRPTIEELDYMIMTRNVSTWADVKTEVLLVLPEVPFDTTIQTWFTKYTFIKRQSAQNADVVDGSDIIENWGP